MDYALTISILLAIYVVLASSLNVVVGHGGLLSLCHAGFYAIGAYASALAALRFGSSFPLSAASAAIFAAGCAALLALPLIKLKGDYFILGSLGFQIIIIDIIHNADAITNGALGLSGIPRPRFFGFEINTPVKYAVAYLLIAGACVLVLHYLTNSPFGKALNAVREDETAATAFGKAVRSIRIRAFAISAAGAGLAGAMYAHYVTYIDASSFTFTEFGLHPVARHHRRGGHHPRSDLRRCAPRAGAGAAAFRRVFLRRRRQYSPAPVWRSADRFRAAAAERRRR